MVEAVVIARPCIDGFFVVACDLVCCLYDVVLDIEFPGVEAGMYWTACAMIIADKGHGAAIGNGGVDWLESLVLSHILFHVL